MRFTIFLGTALFLVFSTGSFGQAASSNTEANHMVGGRIEYLRVPPAAIKGTQPISSGILLHFPAGARTSREILTNKRFRAGTSGGGAATTASSTRNSSSEGNGGHHSGASIRGEVSVPTFTGAFALGSFDFPFIMMGGDPEDGGTTEIPAKIVAVSLQLLNADGSLNFELPYAPLEDVTLDSPNFRESNYTSGRHIQFADAVQRAEFFSSMGEDWHSVLRPAIVDRVTQQIPRFVQVQFPDGSIKSVRAYYVGTAPNGNKFVLLLDLLFNVLINNEFNDEVNANNYTTDAVNMAVYRDTSLFSLDANGGLGPCCVGGFHTFGDDGGTPDNRWVFDFASWDSPGVFLGGVADATSLSHEISETFNDPFVDNVVPVWQFPGIPGFCQGNLETGDPVEVLPNSVVNITLREGHEVFTYHPQTEALLQWFEQAPTSDAIGGAFSYPDTTALTQSATPCQ